MPQAPLSLALFTLTNYCLILSSKSPCLLTKLVRDELLSSTSAAKMAPDRGKSASHSLSKMSSDGREDEETFRNSLSDGMGTPSDGDEVDEDMPLAKKMNEPQNFTVRGVLVGLAIGIVICFSNMYFGLQTGWISSMAMPSALIGFAFFKTVAKHLDLPFSPVENVLVQSVAGSVGTMPLGCGFVGVIPALTSLLRPEENGPLELSLFQLIVWSVGICFFGVIFAVPLRRQVIIREKLKFPSGTACALMIGVLHGNVNEKGLIRHDSRKGHNGDTYESGQSTSDINGVNGNVMSQRTESLRLLRSNEPLLENQEVAVSAKGNWQSRIRLLIVAFVVSAGYVGLTFSHMYISSVADMNKYRRWSHISYHNYKNCQFLVCLLLTRGYGPLTHRRRT